MNFGQFLAGTRRPRDVPWRSPKGSSNVPDLHTTFRGLLGDQQKKKKNDFMKKVFFWVPENVDTSKNLS